MLSKGVKHMLIAGVFFSIMNVGVKYLSHIPPVEIVFFRSLVTLIISAALLTKMKIPLMGNNKKILFLRGLFGVIALSLYFMSLQNLPFASAITIQQLSPIFSTIFAIFILKEYVKKYQWLFFAISFFGVVLIKGIDNDLSMFYLILAVVSAIFSGLAYNMVRKLKDTDHPLVVVLYFPLVAMPIAGLLSIYNWHTPNLKELFVLIAIGIATQIAQVNLTKAFQMEEMGKVSILSYLTIVYALFIGVLFFHESYGFVRLSGIALVVLGVVLNMVYTKKAK